MLKIHSLTQHCLRIFPHIYSAPLPWFSFMPFIANVYFTFSSLFWCVLLLLVTFVKVYESPVICIPLLYSIFLMSFIANVYFTFLSLCCDILLFSVTSVKVCESPAIYIPVLYSILLIHVIHCTRIPSILIFVSFPVLSNLKLPFWYSCYNYEVLSNSWEYL